MSERSTTEIVADLLRAIHVTCNHQPCVLRREAAERLTELDTRLSTEVTP